MKNVKNFKKKIHTGCGSMLPELVAELIVVLELWFDDDWTVDGSLVCAFRSERCKRTENSWSGRLRYDPKGE